MLLSLFRCICVRFSEALAQCKSRQCQCAQCFTKTVLLCFLNFFTGTAVVAAAVVVVVVGAAAAKLALDNTGAAR